MKITQLIDYLKEIVETAGTEDIDVIIARYTHSYDTVNEVVVQENIYKAANKSQFTVILKHEDKPDQED